MFTLFVLTQEIHPDAVESDVLKCISHMSILVNRLRLSTLKMSNADASEQ